MSLSEREDRQASLEHNQPEEVTTSTPRPPKKKRPLRSSKLKLKLPSPPPPPSYPPPPELVIHHLPTPLTTSSKETDPVSHPPTQTTTNSINAAGRDDRRAQNENERSSTRRYPSELLASENDEDEDEEEERWMSSSMCYLKGPAVWAAAEAAEVDPLRPMVDPERGSGQEEYHHSPMMIPTVQANSIASTGSLPLPFGAAEQQNVMMAGGQLGSTSIIAYPLIPTRAQAAKVLCFAMLIVVVLTTITTAAMACVAGYCSRDAGTEDNSPSPVSPSSTPRLPPLNSSTSLLAAPPHLAPQAAPLTSLPSLQEAPSSSASPPLSAINDTIMPTSEFSGILQPTTSPSFNATASPSTIMTLGNDTTIIIVLPSSPTDNDSDSSPAPTTTANTSTLHQPTPTPNASISDDDSPMPTSAPTVFNSSQSPTMIDPSLLNITNATLVPSATPPPPNNTNSTTSSSMIAVPLGDSGATVLLPRYSALYLDDEPESPQSKALRFLSTNYTPEALRAMPHWRKQQLFAMTTLYYALDGDSLPHYVSASWLDSSISECYWQGDLFTPRYMRDSCSVISKESRRQLTQLRMYSPHHDAGSASPKCIPAESLELLPALETMHLEFSGMQPTPLGKLLLLPNGGLDKLQVLSLPSSGLTGTIPTRIGQSLSTSLKELYLFGNQLSGPIPSQLGSLTNLQRLWLNGNHLLSGSIPTTIGLLKDELSLLKLNGNRLSSTLPTQLGLLTQLTRLSLSHNNFVGTIPSQLGLLTKLTELDLGNNHQLSGMIPPGLCQLIQKQSSQNNNATTSDTRFVVDCSVVFCPEGCVMI